MNDTANIKKPNGEIIKAEIISYFELISLKKKYVFYTNRENVENGLIKMYVAEVLNDSNSITINQKMSDEEWNNLKSIMKSILTGNHNPDVRYLKLEGE